MNQSKTLEHPAKLHSHVEKFVPLTPQGRRKRRRKKKKKKRKRKKSKKNRKRRKKKGKRRKFRNGRKGNKPCYKSSKVILQKIILLSLSNKLFGRNFSTILQHPYCVAKGKKFPGCV